MPLPLEYMIAAPNEPVAGNPARVVRNCRRHRRSAASRSGSTITVSWAPPTSGRAITGYTLLVSGSLIGNFSTTGRLLAGSVGAGTYTLSVRAENPCGSGSARGHESPYWASGTFRMRVPSRFEYPNKPPSKNTTWLRV